MSNSAGPKITKDGLVLDFDAANTKSYNFYADPYASNVSLYLKMNGANGSTTFTDSGPNALAVTAAGNAQISTTQSKYESASAYFDGVSDYLSFPTSEGFNFGSGDFTVEFWYYYNGLPQAAARLFQTRNGDLYAGLSITHKFTNRGVDLTFGASTNGSSWTYNNNESGAFSVTANAWTHIAVVRSGTVLYCYINGVQNTIFASFVGSLYYNAADTCVIGGQAGTSRSINGYIDNFKITKGVARYTSAFTSPPIPSTCTDLTKNKNVGTLTNGVDYNFSNGGSLVFDGVNDYVNIPASTNLTFGTGDFTMEVWCKARAKTMLYPALLSVNLAWASNVWVLVDRHNVTAPTKFTFHVYNIASPTLTSVTAPSNGVWYNVVITRIGTLFSMYINGVLESTATSSASIDGGVSNSINLGRQFTSDSTYYDGNIPLARIYKGKGLTSGEVYNNFVANRGRFGV